MAAELELYENQIALKKQGKLAMSLLWSVLFAAAFARHGRRVQAALGFAVFSHFLLDMPMHPPDLALWPNSAVHLGLGLWQRLPTGWWFFELAVIAALCGKASIDDISTYTNAIVPRIVPKILPAAGRKDGRKGSE